MDILLLVKAAILGVVEGLTEFLPVSSTGHLILAGSLLDFNDARGKLFEIVIQSGAIMAVVWEYRQRIAQRFSGIAPAYNEFRQSRAGFLNSALGFLNNTSVRFFVNVGIGFLPLAVIGLVIGSYLKAHLFNAPVVATTFILGAFVILWAERRSHVERVTSIDDMTFLDALKVGVAQCFALIPGTSRSGATIIGGMLFGLSRQVATEFTFFLAIPTLILASAYSLYKERALLHGSDLGMWVVGFVTAFISAFLCVRWLLRYISRHDFTIFAWYRIAFGLVILVTWQMNWVVWADK